MNCSKCNNNVSNIKLLYKCDICQINLCNECAPLTTTEDRCMKLTNRTLKFFCMNCEKKISEYSKSLEMHEKVIQENKLLHTKILEISKSNPTALQCDQNYKKLQEKINRLEDGYRNFHAEIKNCFTSTVKDPLIDEISQIKQNIIDLTESNKAMVKLFTEAPRELQLRRNYQFTDIIKEQQITSKNAEIKNNDKPRTSNQIQVTRTTTETTDDKSEEKGQLNDDGFQEVKRKRKKANQVGTAESPSEENGKQGFEGRPETDKHAKKDKKLWLFISKAKNHVTESIVRNYISKKTNTDIEQISVKFLKTWYQVENNNCFLVGLDPALKSTVYNTNFWPKGVGFERFNFRRGQHFLDNPNEVSTIRTNENLINTSHLTNEDFLSPAEHPSPEGTSASKNMTV